MDRLDRKVSLYANISKSYKSSIGMVSSVCIGSISIEVNKNIKGEPK